MKKNYAFFTLNKNFGLAQSIASFFNRPLHAIQIDRFADSEVQVVLPEAEDLSGITACVIHATNAPVHDNLMQLLMVVHALKQRKVARVIAVVPYFGYARQCLDSGKQGAAALVAQLVQAAGVDALVVVEPHDQQLKQFFSIPFYTVSVHELIAEHIKKTIPNVSTCCIVAPDRGAQERVQKIAQYLSLSTIIFDKERYGVNKVKITDVEGSCSGTCAIIIDDIIDTGKTALQVCHKLFNDDVQTVYGYFVHPVCSGDAIKRLSLSPFKKIFITDSLPLSAEIQKSMEVVSIVESVANVIKRVIDEQ